MRAFQGSASHCEAVPILRKKIAKAEANVVDGNRPRVLDFFDVGRSGQRCKLELPWNRMKENLRPAIVGVELEPIVRKPIENVGDAE